MMRICARRQEHRPERDSQKGTPPRSNLLTGWQRAPKRVELSVPGDIADQLRDRLREKRCSGLLRTANHHHTNQ